MDVDDRARLDTSRVSDVRGQRVALLLGVHPADLTGGGGGADGLGAGSYGGSGLASTQELAEQRQTWFRTGLRTGDPDACDTFGVPEVRRPPRGDAVTIG